MRDISGAQGHARGNDSSHTGHGIFRDAWGIPHLRAADARALAHAQGRVTALDRAWQLEVERHRVQGTSAAFLGVDSLGWDRFARRARLEDTARRCFARLESTDPESADWVRAYVEGVNDGLVEGGRRAPEFARVGLAPGRWEAWHPLGVWLATHILFAGFPAKLWREEAVRHLGADAIGLFATDGPATSGSNGWLVDGSRTTTGQAVIAGDPHRFIEEPGVYQQIHLSCPEFDVVGLAVPGVPGIAHFGHTGEVAWAITNAMADYQDLYRERLRYADRDGDGDGGGGVVEALDPDGVWRAVHRHVEVIEVAGGEPVEVEVIETARGPVVIGGLDTAAPADAADRTGAVDPVGPLSLRYPPRVTEDLGIGALLPLLRAREVADVDRAFDRWAEPVNVVQAADTRGGVLHRVAGRVPVRSRDNRTRVVAAWEPGHEWEGWHETPYGTFEDGVAVMANQRGPATLLGVEFAPPHRAERIRAMLDEKRVWSPADMPTIHMDTHLASAGPLLEIVAAVALADAPVGHSVDRESSHPAGGTGGVAGAGLTPAAVALGERLLRWDRRMAVDSVVAAEYAAVRGAVVRRLAAEPAFAALAVPPAYPEVFRPWLSLTVRIGFALEHLLRAEELYGIDRVALVREALEEVAGRDIGRWGDSHKLVPWRALPDDGTDERPDDGTDGTDGRPRVVPEPGLAGDHDCVLCTSAVPGITDLSARGPAARYVWDLARREDSLWVVPFGASGVGGSAHHRDQLPLWLRGDLVPVVTDWDRFTEDEHTDHSTEEMRHDH
ncbi:penicillin acylase family protein [Streptomyces sp. SP18BB07]|uniref:penicillin acylase family protein n=1 Tax=Streptomyces sp. SP18BB07 TaxID=3002522 RepID=UPI002E7627DB|nr:penicillin acylase family protein [Streptomyces sp. SP18BB07]MEE1762984.1 penicillin acylase family protein [Streptomyces sp. SP18BB07]